MSVRAPAPIPESIKVGHLVYRVECSAESIDRASRDEGVPYGAMWGGTDHKRLVVALDPESGPANNRAILWHELHHAVRHAGSVEIDRLPDDLDDREESIIRAFASPMLGVLRDNPALVAYLTSDG